MRTSAAMTPYREKRPAGGMLSPAAVAMTIGDGSADDALAGVSRPGHGRTG